MIYTENHRKVLQLKWIQQFSLWKVFYIQIDKVNICLALMFFAADIANPC